MWHRNLNIQFFLLIVLVVVVLIAWPAQAWAARPQAPIQHTSNETGSTGEGQPFEILQPSLALHYIIQIHGQVNDIGSVMLYAGVDTNALPEGWVLANGALLNPAEHPELFVKLGNTYGGDGRTTFALPDFRGRIAIGTGQVEGLTERSLGSKVGTETTALTTAQLPPHAHSSSTTSETGPAGESQAYETMQPSLGVHYLLQHASTDSSDIGSIKLYAGVDAYFQALPLVWFPARGQSFNIGPYSTLFSKFFTTYGGDLEIRTFVLPDLRGRTAIGAGQGEGLSNHPLGKYVGAEAATLNVSQLPEHLHTLSTTSQTGTTGEDQPYEILQPSLALHYIIQIQGEQRDIGSIMLYAGVGVNMLPEGWVLANGALFNIAEHPELFAKLGNTYGGDGRTTFALPDLRGRTAIGAGQGHGLTNRPLGTYIGTEAGALTIAQLPAHRHRLDLPEINVQGNGATIIHGDTNPSVDDGTNFGSTHINGDTVVHTFTLYNRGHANLTVSAIQISGNQASDFTINGLNTPAIIPPNSSADFTVTFSPAMGDRRTATIEITNDDSDEPHYTFAVEGIGIAPRLQTGTPSVWGTHFPIANGWDGIRYIRTIGDVDGNGDADLVGFGHNYVFTALSKNNNRFDAAQRWLADEFTFSNGWRTDRHVRLLCDVTGDGQDDIVGFGEQNVVVAVSDGNGFAPSSTWLANHLTIGQEWRVTNHIRTCGDIDGDGDDDLVAFGLNHVIVHTSDGSSFQDEEIWLPDELTFNFGWHTNQHVRLLCDVTGDGRDDIVAFGEQHVFVAPSTGNGFGPLTTWLPNDFTLDQGWNVTNHVRTCGDVDGDGDDDLVAFGASHVFVRRSNGIQFGARETWVENSFSRNSGWTSASEMPRLVADVNQDGKVDIIGFGSEGITVALNTTEEISSGRGATVTLSGGQTQREDAGGETTYYTFTATLTDVGDHEGVRAASVPKLSSITVPYRISDGTATAVDGDYRGTNGVLTFEGTLGETQTITVAVPCDEQVEGDEYFVVELGEATLARAASSNAETQAISGTIQIVGSPQIGTILNDDEAVVTLSGDSLQSEGNDDVTIYLLTATLEGAVADGFTIAYSVDDGTATVADDDYIDSDGLLTFTGILSETQYIAVAIQSDTRIEPDEHFSVALGTITNTLFSELIRGNGTPHVVTILNDDGPDSATAEHQLYLPLLTHHTAVLSTAPRTTVQRRTEVTQTGPVTMNEAIAAYQLYLPMISQ